MRWSSRRTHTFTACLNHSAELTVHFDYVSGIFTKAMFISRTLNLRKPWISAPFLSECALVKVCGRRLLSDFYLKTYAFCMCLSTGVIKYE